MEREAERIACVDDDGKRYTIVAYQSYVDGGTAERPVSWVKPSKRWALDDGRDVTRNADDSFEITDAGRIVRRVL